MRDALEGYQIPEPEGLWEGIESGLSQKTSVKVRKPLFRVAAAVSAAAAAVAVLVLAGRHNVPVVPVTDNMVAAVEESSVVQLPDAEFAAVNSADVLISAAPKASVPSSLGTSAGLEQGSEAVPSVVEENAAVESEVTPVESGIKENVKRNVKQEPAVDIEEYFRTNEMKAARKVRKVSLLASASGAGSFSESFRSHGIMSMSDNSVVYAANSLANCFSDVTGYTKVIWSYSAVDYDIDTEYEHRQPIRLSFEVEYPLSANLALVSGLSFTRLESDIVSNSLMSNYKSEQRLDYAGVPLALKYRVVGNSGYGLYARAGAMVEKNFSGYSVTKYFHDGVYRVGRKEPVREKGLQYSLNLSLGSDFRILGPVRAFVEPGLSFYPDNGSDVKNIYKEKPLNFNLAIGIRTDL